MKAEIVKKINNGKAEIDALKDKLNSSIPYNGI